MKTTIKIPPKLISVFSKPRGELRYRGAYGGRGSGKSFNFAQMACVFGVKEPLRILCTREFQNSIKESFYQEVKESIDANEFLSSFYEVGESFIRGKNGTEFIFKGLRNNTNSIKSLAHIDICIVEEAEDIPEVAWQKLLPTIRAEKSEVWVIWNPREKESPTNKRFKENTPDNSLIVEMNYSDNPMFPKVLENERLRDKELLDDATYRHIWEGDYLELSEAQVFKDKYLIEEFTPAWNWNGAYQGLDFGFSSDPLAAIKMWIFEEVLYIEYEAVKKKLDLDRTTPFILEEIPEFDQYKTRGDNSRPESISYLQSHGLPLITACKKWKGCVEDGVAFIKSFKKVVIHPRCIETIKEFRYYSYKVDRLSGDILPIILDANNHCIDAIRYALEPMITRKQTAMDILQNTM